MRSFVSKHGFSREMVVISDSLVPNILKSLHSGPSVGHMGYPSYYTAVQGTFLLAKYASINC